MEQVTTQAKAFDPGKWFMQVAASTGVEHSEVPELGIGECKTKDEVNKRYFDWYYARQAARPEIPEAMASLCTSLVSVTNSSEYQNILNNIKAYETRINSAHQNAVSYASSMMDYRAKLDQLTGKAGQDLTPELMKIIEAGWYQLSEGATLAFNRVRQPREQGFVFYTPRVYTKHQNKAANIDLSVDMGRYQVNYMPNLGRIQVLAYEDNIISDGYVHPHVSGGEVCWGNASMTYTSAMQSFTPSKAFNALQVILTTYNDESPYRYLTEFAVLRDPKMFEGTDVEYKMHYEKCWVREGDLPAYFDYDNYSHDDRCETDEDGDEYEEKLINLFTKNYVGTGVRVPHSGYYVRLTPNRGRAYVEFDGTLVEFY